MGATTDQRARITRGEDFLLFDPTAGALASAMGQVRLSSSRPIPFLMERALYLVRGGPEGSWWGYRPDAARRLRLSAAISTSPAPSLS
jgi:hypothetical protein